MYCNFILERSKKMDFLNRKDFLVGRFFFNDDRDSLDSCFLDSYMDSDVFFFGYLFLFYESGCLILESVYIELIDLILILIL